MNKKSLIKLLSFPLSLGVISLVAISCSKTYSHEEKLQKGKEELNNVKFIIANAYDYSKVDWTKVNYIEAQIEKWADGDTPFVKNLKPGDNEISKNYFNDNKPFLVDGIKIRVLGIDTPEKNVNGTDAGPLEYTWASVATKFGETAIPANQKVRIMIEGKDVYNRFVGSIYFGNNFELEYSTEIVRAGYTLPNGSTSSDALVDRGPLSRYYNYYGITLAYAEAKKNKNGFWKYFKDENDVTHTIDGIYVMRSNNGWKIFSDKNIEYFTTIKNLVDKYIKQDGKKLEELVFVPQR
ncbi:thermonuclease family protein [Mycoplasmopsis alligatoris]|uniref:Nuclease-like protein n=1 Tax=Mycoplasmopsis alligatoris A21JP2 TaxID=747682 RepID=D4XWR1_9BACT|nr:thermonuclease family protein [Mycoplasmopsis alligatoris]EFF41311.1 nuclease-like protein [Mycoplasmopsis alligatoris A21JP2]